MLFIRAVLFNDETRIRVSTSLGGVVYLLLGFVIDTELFNDQYRVATARLRGYDYGQNGAYFVTICTQQRVRYFGEMEVPAQNWTSAYLRPTPHCRGLLTVDSGIVPAAASLNV